MSFYCQVIDVKAFVCFFLVGFFNEPLRDLLRLAVSRRWQNHAGKATDYHALTSFLEKK